MHRWLSFCVAGLVSVSAFAGPKTVDTADRAVAMLTASDQVDAALARRVADALGDDWSAGRSLRHAADLADTTTPQLARLILQGAAERVRADLSFRPLVEADTPPGFPQFTIVGEIDIKQYPTYRVARAGKDVRDPARFWTLFQHIQKHDIPMTAPVEMTIDMSTPRVREQDMGFLYPTGDTGAPGRDGMVDVVDVAPVTVVSIGQRGGISPGRILDATQQLEAWLAANAGRYERAGEVRVMGYNSPMVPRAQQYHEVQIPIRPRTTD